MQRTVVWGVLPTVTLLESWDSSGKGESPRPESVAGGILELLVLDSDDFASVFPLMEPR